MFEVNTVNEPETDNGFCGVVVPIPTFPVNLPSVNEPVPLELIFPVDWIVPLELMFPLAVMWPVTFIPPADVSNFVELLCFNNVPAPSVN